MTIIKIRDAGAVGLVSDVPGHEIVPQAWTTVSNVKFKNRAAVKTKGAGLLPFGSLSGNTPQGIFHFAGRSARFWVYATNTKVFAWNSTTADITRVSGDYTASNDTHWNGCWLDGVAILNNGIDLPQAWTNIDSATKLIDLPNWPGTHRAKVMRKFKNFALALDISKSSVRYPTTILWSHPADPGAVPASWDVADATYLAGEVPLSFTQGEVVDGVEMKNSFIIYKSDAIILMQYIGGNSVFSFSPISTEFGIPNQDCAKEFMANRQVLFTSTGDVAVCDGQTVTVISEGMVKDLITAQLNETYIGNSYVVVNQREKEVWICFPTGTAEYPNYALVWRYNEKTWGAMEFTAECKQMAVGDFSYAVVDESWDGQPDISWEDKSGTWDSGSVANATNKIMGIFPKLATPAVWHMDYSWAWNGNPVSSKLERKGLSVIGQMPDGSMRVDPTVNKLVTKVWPLLDAPMGGAFNLQLGAQQHKNDAITWGELLPFDPSVDGFVEPFIEGKLIAFRLIHTGNEPWSFYGYDIEVHVTGGEL